MGRGRKGPVEQSFKKPRHAKNEQWAVMWSGKKEKKKNPVLLSEVLLQETQRIGAQNLMKILLPGQVEDPEGSGFTHRFHE